MPNLARQFSTGKASGHSPRYCKKFRRAVVQYFRLAALQLK
jgi:hypothetical protein